METPGLYRQRKPQETLYYQLVQHYLESWLATRREANPDSDPIPAHVEEAFRKFLTRGIYCYGFARLRCSACGYEALLPYSCRARGPACPSCASKYMAMTASHLTDNVLPRVPFRQVVLTVPKRIRFFLQQPIHEQGLRRIFLRALEATVRAACPGAPPDARFGAVVFTHRAGASLNPHPHFHVTTSDGTFAIDEHDQLVFYEATELTDAHFEALTETVRQRVLRYLVRHHLLDHSDAMDMLEWQGSGGFSVDGSVTTAGDDRFALERLVRYCARPPWASSRLGRLDEDTLVYQLPPGDIHGRDNIILHPLELLDRLAQLIPPPRRHRHTYAGVLAPNAALRPLVAATAGPDPALAIRLYQAACQMGLAEELGLVEPQPTAATAEVLAPEQKGGQEGATRARPALPEPAATDEHHAGHQPDHLPGHQSDPQPGQPAEDTSSKGSKKRARRASVMWAMLLARIYEVLPLRCPLCHGPLKIISFINDRLVIDRILSHLDMETKPPPVHPARGPPDPELPFEATEHDRGLDVVDDDPGFDFDQSCW